MSIARNENESFEDYKQRRAESNRAVKALKRGVLFHDSAIYGTYVDVEKQAAKAAHKAQKALRRSTSNQLKQQS